MTTLRASRRVGVAFLLCTLAATSAQAQNFDSLFNFEGTNGAWASSPLVQGNDGNFYGTTRIGGTNNLGSVFKITADGTVTTLYNFTGGDGAEPQAPLVLATDGDLYGTTTYGGHTKNYSFGYGTIFRISAQGNLKVLHKFDDTSGFNPWSGLVQATNGKFYGTTAYGGNTQVSGMGYGTVFVMTPGGEFATLYEFNGPDGISPTSQLVQSTDGNFYGTTAFGGVYCDGQCGTVFKITPKGTLTTLHSFDISDGNYPYAGLIQATDGNFYGTTYNGGANPTHAGTIFRITPQGRLTTLHNFHGTDGGHPLCSLTQATNGALYGTTRYDGDNTVGTIFTITLKGKLTTLHSFDTGDGAYPESGLLQATSGTFYGNTFEGGDLSCYPPDGCGTAFSLSAGLGPFVTFVRAAGRVGQTGPILGQGFTGTTGVSINGIEANFIVVSDTLIHATVPAGATTGYLTVTTPSGTLTSNVPFHVIR